MSSLEITIFRFFGSSESKFAKISLIALEASIALALSLKDISRVTASCPLTLAYEVKSLKVLLTDAISPNVTIASLVTFTGIAYISLADSMMLGTSMLKLPRPVSCFPPGIIKLLLATEL